MTNTTRLTVRVAGRVQGVFFRASTREQADALALSGWVRNDMDGSVSAVAEGTADALATWLGWIQAGGPPAARVDRVDVERGDATGEFIGFTVLR
ncbi:MAG: acylphosphatase [Bradymonadia bacterium]|jgi:acylphosphatase